MTPAELKKIGRRLFGPDWQSPLARAIGKHRITVWRWITRNVPIPEDDIRSILLLYSNTVDPKKSINGRQIKFPNGTIVIPNGMQAGHRYIFDFDKLVIERIPVVIRG